jgi:hypothetical protein
MLVIAGSTSKELARQVSYLKAENQILPYLPPSPRFGIGLYTKKPGGA